MAAEAAALPFVPSHAVLEHLCWLICWLISRARASSRALGRGAGIESLADGDGEARVMGSVAQTEEDVTRMESSEESSDGVLLFDDEGNDGGGFGSWSRSEELPPERAPPLAPACVLRADALPHQARHSRARASPHGLSIPPAARLSEGDVLWLCSWPFPRTLSSDVDAD